MPKNDAHTPARSVTVRIHEAYGGLPEGERQIADVVLEAPAELAVVNAGELARRAGVSNATVSR
ncbi:MAG: MurR/RpiR family transcriptional regulator, partial [Maritimibacter sp.]|nr:MurR/RpiR family transcriptional regulator [Maritimibacter sp.]